MRESYIRVRGKLGGGWIWELMTPDRHVANESEVFADRIDCEADAKLQGLQVSNVARRGKFTGKTYWVISKDSIRLWRWRRIDANGTVTAISADGFPTKAECVDDARRNGYTGGSSVAATYG